MVGKTRWEVAGVPDPDADPAWRRHKQDLEARRPFHGLVYRLALAGLDGRWVEAGGIPVFGADGDFRGYRGTSRDVSISI